jgi:tRNA modification GTPase
MFATDDTIVAIATPPGRGGLGVVRLSGPEADRIARALLDRREPLEARRATFARAAGIDQVIATAFPAPASYTGEDVVEISAHGSPVLLHLIVRAAIAAGARLARPGEFTLRAFLNGRIDLVQAEAVADLIDAATPLQARLAFDQLEGTISTALAGLEARLFDLAARLEASIDFPDEGYHFIEPAAAAREIAGLADDLAALLRDAARGRLIREGRLVVIAGSPNVGKSSIFNYLAGTDRAIVTPHEGTTRDLLSERVEVQGVPVTLVDSAGVRETVHPIEREGVERARGALASADAAIVVLDRSRPLGDADRALVEETARTPRVIVANKRDLPAEWDVAALGVEHALEVSMLTGDGADALRPAIWRALASGDDLRDTAALSNIRQIDLARRAHAALERARAAAIASASEEFVLAELEASREALAEITGARTTDDVLRHIFERFCVGK